MVSSIVFQVRLTRTGPWHKKHANGTRTACDLPIVGAYLSREHVLDEHLCSACFSDDERDTGQMKKIEAKALGMARADAIVEEWRGEDDEITDEHDPPVPAPDTLPMSREESGEIDTDSHVKKGRR